MADIPQRKHKFSPLGDLADFGERPLEMLHQMVLEYPAIVRIRLAHLPYYVVNTPDTVTEVLQRRARDYRKEPYFMTIARDMLISDDNLFTSDDDAWLKRRRLMQPTFHRKIIADWTRLIQEKVAQLAAEWEPHVDIDMEEAMMDVTMSIIGHTMLSRDILKDEPHLYEAFEFASKRTIERAMNVGQRLIPLWVPTATNHHFKASLESIRELFEEAITERQQMAVDERPSDLLTLLLAAQDDETGFALSREELMDELFGIVDAGHETSSVALAWLFYELATDPAIQERLCAELAEVWAAEEVTAEMVMGLPYLTAVINETLRRYPSAYTTTRQSIVETEIDGHPIPAKMQILINIYGLHHHPDYWQEPLKFDPERWERDEIHKNAFIPFLIGPRKCIGEPLAQLEMRLTVIELLRRYRVVSSERSSTLVAQFTLRSKDGIWVELEPR
ncbi:MAG TPA: cytochrome P450 [Anaerolineae bacterium]|nr:cytochrome P450 [Anaerolineae bacterium]